MTRKWPRQYSDGSITVGGLRGLSAFLEDLGSDPARLMQRSGLDPALLDNDDDQRGISLSVPLSTVAFLLASAAKETRCPHLGLLMAQAMEASLLGPVGFLMMHSPTVSAALSNLIRFIHLRVDGVELTIASETAVARIECRLPACGAGVEQIQDASLASMVCFLRLACGKHWTPDAVYLEHERPDDLDPYHAIFGRTLRFGASTNAIGFDAALLQKPVRSADPEIGNMLRRYVLELEQEYKGNLQAKIKSMLPALLSTGKCTVDRVAELFSMHRRTLHRYLADQGVTFEQLVDDVRFEIAFSHLRSNDCSMGQLALLLGYHDASAFSRAFRRRTGLAPSAWRDQQPQPD